MANTRALAGLALLALAACGLGLGIDTTMSLAGFDTSCTQAADCAVVQVGSLCGCNCGNAAINVKGIAAYQSEANTKHGHCGGPIIECDCISVSAVCTKGQCEAMSP